MDFFDGLVRLIDSPNFIRAATTALITIAIVYLLSRSGLLTIHTKFVTMGIQDREHTIMRKQLIYAKQACNAFIQYIPRGEEYDEWHGKCVAEYVYDEMVDWIALNHIEATRSYISLRQTAIWNIILAHVDKPEHKTEDFRDVVYKHVEDDIKALVEIRNNQA